MAVEEYRELNPVTRCKI